MKKSSLIFIMLIITGNILSNAQPGFQKVFQCLSDTLPASFFRNTNDGGVLIKGTKYSPFQTLKKDYLLKVTGSYSPEWAKYYLPFFPQSFFIYDVMQLSNKDYVVTGIILDSLHAVNNKMFLMRTDSTGVPRFIKAYRNPSNPNLGMDDPLRILRITDDTFYIIGKAWGNVGGITVYKMNIDGQMISVKYILGNNWSHTLLTTQALQMLDGNFLISAYYDEWYQTGIQSSILLVKIDTSLNVIWQNTIQSNAYLHSGDAFTDNWGNVIFRNQFDSTGTGAFYFSKMSASGSILWNKTLPQYNIFDSYYNGIAINDKYFFLGAEHSNAFLLVTDTSGTLIEKKFIGGTINTAYVIQALQRNDRLLLLSIAKSNSLYEPQLILTDSLFNTNCSTDTLPGTTNDLQIVVTPSAYQETPVYSDSDITASISTVDITFISSDNCIPTNISSNNDEYNFTVFVTGKILVVNSEAAPGEMLVRVVDLLGKTKFSNRYSGTGSIFNLSQLSSGVYIVCIKAEDKVITKKIILQD